MRVNDVVVNCRRRSEQRRDEIWWEQFYRDLGLAATGLLIWGFLFCAMLAR
ncbi:MAG TPA: hypothetical protein P5056_03900 [Candidatus Paceibacterota bacterium]|nr:hypothetical protein [Candidatus Paceibacterota bacterium]